MAEQKKNIEKKKKRKITKAHMLYTGVSVYAGVSTGYIANYVGMSMIDTIIMAVVLSLFFAAMMVIVFDLSSIKLKKEKPQKLTDGNSPAGQKQQ